MNNNRIYKEFVLAKESGEKKFAVLIDPDKLDHEGLREVVLLSVAAQVDFLFVGGSLMTTNRLNEYISEIKAISELPVILFPGSVLQISSEADALFFLSLISGRNADLLIGKHVEAAPILKNTEIEVISTGYILIDGGAPTTASYISNSLPIPADKPDIAACTALAGEMIGMSAIYLDTGSGAKNPVSQKIISEVQKNIHLPIIVGGGINNISRAEAACRAGADIIVVGNAIEKDPSLIKSVAIAVHSYNPLNVN